MQVEGGERFGPYEVHERLGAGGMATVYRARYAGTGADVALKQLFPQLSASPEFVQSFLGEAQLARRLRHPNVAATYDFGVVGETYYIAMELVQGPTLGELLERCVERDRAVPPRIALAILGGLCDALAYAHALTDEHGAPLGIVHRDVTPSNVIIADTGVTKLIDFGIAKATSQGTSRRSGVIKGKFAYVAPEYVAGQLDARADLFAFGVVAHELLTRRRLFQVPDEAETLRRAQTLAIEPPSQFNAEVTGSLDAIVMTALERDPEQRWQSAAAISAALARIGPRAEPSEVAHWVSELSRVRRTDPSVVAIEIGRMSEPHLAPPWHVRSRWTIGAVVAALLIAILLAVR